MEKRKESTGMAGDEKGQDMKQRMKCITSYIGTKGDSRFFSYLSLFIFYICMYMGIG